MINIQKIIPLLKEGYIAQDKSGAIYWYENLPIREEGASYWTAKGACESFKDFSCLKDIEPWADDWKNSVIEIKE